MSEKGWLPNEFGVYDTRTDGVSGFSLGSTLSYCIGKAFDWPFVWDKISNYIYNQNCAPYYNLMTGKQHGQHVASSGTDFMEEVSNGNTTVILCYAPSNQSPSYSGVATSFYGPQTRHNRRNGSTATFNNGTGASLWQYRVILNSVECERYLVVPLITARDETGNLVQNVEWGTYMSTYANTYPFITQIYLNYYYKPDLWATNVSQVNFCFCVRPQRNKQYLDNTNEAGYPYYIREIYDSDVVLAFSHYIFNTPLLQSTPATLAAYTTSLYTDTATHNVYQFHDSIVGTGISPFLYITPAIARSIINSIGFWWCDSLTAVQNDAHGIDSTSDAVHAVRITEGGATTKTDFTGENIRAHWSDPGYLELGGHSIINGNRLDPQGEDPDPDDPNKPGREDPPSMPDDDPVLELDEPAYTGIGCFSTYYSMAMADVARLNNDLWTSDDSTITALIEGLRFWGTDPMQAVMSLRLYPFDVNAYISHSEKTHIKIGRVEMPVASGWILDNNATAILNMGWIAVKPQFNDFRDYYPYTQIKLYIPFIGMIDLNANEIMNKKVEIQMVVDITTGTCEVCILANSKPLVYQSGNMGVEIPITLNTMQGLSQSIMQGIFSMSATALMGGAEQLIHTGGAPLFPTITKTTYENERLNYLGNESSSDIGNIAAQLTLGASTSSQTGKSTPACNMANPLYPYIVITTPSWEIPENYAHTYGKVCHTSGLVSTFSGFTVCRNVDTTGINCTEMEQNMIKSLLESGVYL
ncbi:MAG: hypothetical protein IKY41_09545 [Clostridia bacterium]|nr:hypothetical protein [Clostridia bacterium]